MKFKLKDFPPDEAITKLSERFRHLDPLSLKACFLLLRSGTEIFQEFDAFLKKYELTQGRFLVMSVMNRTPEDPCTPTALAEELGVSRATMTSLLDGLERAGFIERSINEVDRRQMKLTLTPKGLALMEEILPDYYRGVASVMECLSPEERTQFVSLLEKVKQSLVDESSEDSVDRS